MLSPLRLSSLLACLLLAASVVACSEAETPDAWHDGGVTDLPFDAGPGFGSRDEPCANGRCESNALVCVAEPQPGGGTQNMCRERCDLNDQSDPCGTGSTCVRLLSGDGACLPAGGLDEPCPCDEGYACAALQTADGERENICKRACAPDGPDGEPVDAGPGAVVQCPGQQTCRPLQGSDNLGVCLDD